jgi:hypothetical protein
MLKGQEPSRTGAKRSGGRRDALARDTHSAKTRVGYNTETGNANHGLPRAVYGKFTRSTLLTRPGANPAPKASATGGETNPPSAQAQQ